MVVHYDAVYFFGKKFKNVGGRGGTDPTELPSGDIVYDVYRFCSLSYLYIRVGQRHRVNPAIRVTAQGPRDFYYFRVFYSSLRPLCVCNLIKKNHWTTTATIILLIIIIKFEL